MAPLDASQQKELFYRLQAALYKGGTFGYLWACSEDRKPRKLKRGIKYTDPAFKRTYWFNTNNLPLIPNKQTDSGLSLNVYFGLNPTHRQGTPFQRTAKSATAKSPNVVCSNVIYADFDAKDFDPELADASRKYKDFLASGGSIHHFTDKICPLRGLSLAKEHIDGLALTPSVLVCSGGGYNAYWLLDETVFFDQFGIGNFSNIQEQFVHVTKADSNAKDMTRVLRVPGTLNQKRHYAKGPLPVYFEYYKEQQYSLDDIQHYISSSSRHLFPAATAAPAPSPATTRKANPSKNRRAKAKTVSFSSNKNKIKAIKALSGLSQERCNQYQDWIQVGLALYHEFQGDEWALQLWDEWSQKSQKYEEGACETKWPTFGNSGKKLGLGSLIMWAKEDSKEFNENEISFDQLIQIANSMSKNELLLAVDDWVEHAVLFDDDQLSKICKVLRVNGLSIRDTEQWKKSVLKLKKSSQTKTARCFIEYDSQLLEHPANDFGHAESFIKYKGSKYRFVNEWGPLYWSGTHWDRVSAHKYLFSDIRNHLLNRLQAATAAHDLGVFDEQQFDYWVRGCKPSTARIKAVTSQVVNDPRLDARPSDFDQHPNLLTVKNGIVDLSSNQFYKHDPSFMMTHCLHVPYYENANQDLIWDWLDTLELAQKKLSFLQQSIGYGITGYTREECFFYLSGPPRSGKGILMTLLKNLLREPLINEIDTQILMSSRRNSDAQNFALAPLVNSRLVVAQETSRSNRLTTELIKNITGNDKIYCAFKGKTHFSYSPRFKVWMTSNYPPKPDDIHDEAFWHSRLRWFQFHKSFLGQEDKTLKTRINSPEYLEAFLAWAIDGARLWSRSISGLNTPDYMKYLIESEQAKQDYIAQWLAENTDLANSDSFQAIRNLYNDYKEWCENTGMRPKLVKEFSRILEAKGFVRHTGRLPGSRKKMRGFKGIRLLS